MNKLMTRKEVTEMLSISTKTLARMEKEHDFPAAHQLTTKCYRYSKDDINEWLKTRRINNTYQDIKPALYKKAKSKKVNIKSTEEIHDFLINHKNREGLLTRCN